MRGGLVTFETTIVFQADGTQVTAPSTLRFRTRDEVYAALTGTGFRLDQVRGAPDRPGLEFVVLATAV